MPNVRKLALLLDLEKGQSAAKSPLAQELLEQGWDVVTVDLRATGATAYSRDKIRRAPDHNTAEWSLWIGRPMLGQWVWDVRRLLDALADHPKGLPDQTALIGVGPASLIALCTSALDSRITSVASVGGLTSFVTDTPYENQRLGILVPGILRDIGDVSRIAALSSPRRTVIASGVNGSGQTLSEIELKKNYATTNQVFRLAKSPENLRLLADPKPKQIVAALP